jgi:hypothetical protein
MVVVEPAQPRYVMDELPGGILFTIRQKRNWFGILFLAFWLAFWLMGEVLVLGIVVVGLLNLLLNRRPPGPAEWGVGIFLLAWLGGWTVGGLFAIRAWLWSVAGREVISVRADFLRIERGVPLWHRAEEYRMADISSLRLSQPSLSASESTRHAQLWGVYGGLLAFDYGASTVRFGIGLEEAEAKQILNQIGQRYSHLVARDRGDHTARSY